MTTHDKRVARSLSITRALPFAGPAFTLAAMFVIGATTTVAMML
jgi:hypothetical protein